MKITETKWAVFSTNHPKSKEPVFFSDTISETKKEAIENFIKGSGASWKEWREKYKYRAAKVRITIDEI